MSRLTTGNARATCILSNRPYLPVTWSFRDFRVLVCLLSALAAKPWRPRP